jgi:uncharacterized protein YihD (DUF1040 family)
MMTGRMRRLPWMVGVVDAEGIYPVGGFIANEAELKKFDEEFDDLVPHLLDYHHTVDESERLEVTRKIRKEYFGDKKITKDSVKEIIKVGYICLIILFFPVLRFILHLSQNLLNNYILFNFEIYLDSSYHSEKNFLPSILLYEILVNRVKMPHTVYFRN